MVPAAPAARSGASGSSGGSAKASGKKIALLLPESKTTRYESLDRPLFEAAVKAQCPDCTVIYSNADQDAAKQQQQAESALTQGANVLVLDPVDSKAAASIANSAKGSKVPVIAYDRFISGSPVDYYVSFDNEKVGQLQGQTLVDLMKKAGKTSGKIVMINGSPTDTNAGQFKKGAHSVLDESGYTIAGRVRHPGLEPRQGPAVDGEPDHRRQERTSPASTPPTTAPAGGAIAALKGGGVTPLPPVTGQDAELAAIQRILAGDQAMTVYKAIKPEAEDAAKAAIALASGQKPRRPTTTYNGTGDIPRPCSIPVAVTKDNIKDTVVKDGIYKVATSAPAERRQGLRRRRHQLTEGTMTTHHLAGRHRHRPVACSGVSKRFGAVQALKRHRAGRARRRGGRPGRRQRRRQVHPGQDHRRGLQPRRRGTIDVRRQAGQHRRAPPRPSDLGIATVFQDLALCDNLDVVGNLFLGRELRTHRRPGRGRDGAARPGRCCASCRPRSLACGSRSPASPAASGRPSPSPARCSASPKVVMLDEPTAALGVAQTAEVLNLVERLRERGLGVILISHNMADVMAVADRVAVLRLGRNNGDLPTSARPATQEIIAAITGATDNAVSRAAARQHRGGAVVSTSDRPGAAIAAEAPTTQPQLPPTCRTSA